MENEHKNILQNYTDAIRMNFICGKNGIKYFGISCYNKVHYYLWGGKLYVHLQQTIFHLNTFSIYCIHVQKTQIF